VPRKTKTPGKEAEAAVNVASDAVISAPKTRRAPAKAARKTPAKKAAKKGTAKTVSAAAAAALPTDEDIRLRAYFIAERRHRLALPGNADSDWLEAIRQLQSEVSPR
jgi:DUF2934 family protein